MSSSPSRPPGSTWSSPTSAASVTATSAPTGSTTCAAHVRDLHALLVDGLGLDRVVLCGGDLGGPVVQMLALDHPALVERLVLFNSPLPYDKERMAGMASRAAGRGGRLLRAPGPGRRRAGGRPRHRRSSGAATSRPSTPRGSGPTRAAFMGDATAVFGPYGGTPQVDFHTEPFGDAAKLRASFGGYESVFDPTRQSEPAPAGPERGRASPAAVRDGRPRHLSRLRRDGGRGVPRSRRAAPARPLRPLRALGGRRGPGGARRAGSAPTCCPERRASRR